MGHALDAIAGGAEMITKRLFLSGIVTTAAVATASHYLPTVIKHQQYATVYGVGWDGEAIEHHIYEPMSVAHFGGTSAIDKFREVTEWVYAFPVEPLPKTYRNPREAYAIDPLWRWSKPVQVQENGFTNIIGYWEMQKWRDSLRPDLPRDPDGAPNVKWVQEQIKSERDYEANAAKYIAEMLGKGTKNA